MPAPSRLNVLRHLSLLVLAGLIGPAVVLTGCQAPAGRAEWNGVRQLCGLPLYREGGAEELMGIAQRVVSKVSDPGVAAWGDEGGPAAIEYLNGALVVTQTRHGHDRLAQLLDVLHRKGAISADLKDPFPAELGGEALAATRALLDQKIDLEAADVPLADVLRALAAKVPTLNLTIDTRLADSGIDLDKRTADLKAKGQSVAWILDHLLTSNLGYMVEPGYVRVTAAAVVQANLSLGVYGVKDRDGKAWQGDPDLSAAMCLTAIIQRTVNNQSDPRVAAWSDEGGPAAIEYLNGVLLVTQTPRGHERTGALLRQLARRGAVKADAGDVLGDKNDAGAADRTGRLLDEPIDLSLRRTSLKDALAAIDRLKPDLHLTVSPNLADAKIDLTNRLVDLEARQLPVRSALDLLLGPELDYTVDAGHVVVALREELHKRLIAVAYKLGP